MSPLQILLIVAVATFTVSEVSAIKCYVCTGTECGDEYTATDNHSEECGDSSTQCLKVKVNDAVVRSCSTGGSVGCTEAHEGGDSGWSCVCEGDNCNSAGMASASILVVLAAALMKFIC